MLIPSENRKDVAEIPKRILKKVELGFVEHTDEVLKEALILSEGKGLFAPEEECKPFSFADIAQMEESAPTGAIAH